MASLFQGSLQRRIILLVALGMGVLLGALGVSSFFAVQESIDRALQERLNLAQITADHLEYVLQQNLRRLGDITYVQGVNFEDKDMDPEKKALHDAYFQTIFKEGVFIIDKEGVVLWTEPYHPQWLGTPLHGYDYFQNALQTGRPLISDLYPIEPSGRLVVSAVTPIKNSAGAIVGLAGGNLDLTGTDLQEVIQPVRLGKTGHIEVVDSKGVVLASTDPKLLLTQSDHGNTLSDLIRQRQTTVGTCHSCHQSAQEPNNKKKEVMAFAPLTAFSWGVSVRQSESEALAPAHGLRQKFSLFGISLILVASVLAWGMARSLVRPLKVLTSAAQRIAQVNFSEPIPNLGNDEIGQLAQQFNATRVQLKGSMEKIQEWNRELERRVQGRTKELEESRAARGELLRKLISAQEEERRRIARELHDETSQAMAALTMAIDTAMAAPPKKAKEWREKLADMKILVVKMLDGVHQMILDIRPSVLDDLGLLAALRGYAESHLEARGIKVHLEISGVERRLPPQIETALFRVTQEAITNIAKHAEAENVMINVEFKDFTIAIEIEDDGKGFDVEAVTRSSDRTRGLGLLGMQERMALFNGNLVIQSEPGSGTRLVVEIPFDVEEASHG